MRIKPANTADGQSMSDVLDDIFAAGLRKTPGDLQTVLANYIEHPDRIECSVAEGDDGRILGFQSLRYARAGNPYGAPEGWGIIGTHVSPRAARLGVGRALFQATVRAARAYRVDKIEAAIGANNPAGLAYYEAIGFRTYRETDETICKVYLVKAVSLTK